MYQCRLNIPHHSAYLYLFTNRHGFLFHRYGTLFFLPDFFSYPQCVAQQNAIGSITQLKFKSTGFYHSFSIIIRHGKFAHRQRQLNLTAFSRLKPHLFESLKLLYRHHYGTDQITDIELDHLFTGTVTDITERTFYVNGIVPQRSINTLKHEIGVAEPVTETPQSRRRGEYIVASRLRIAPRLLVKTLVRWQMIIIYR